MTTTVPLNGETLISVGQACRLLPGRKGHVSPPTVVRWMTKGCRSASGGIVRLESVRIGASIWTSAEAVGRFLDALNTDGTVKRPTPYQRRHASEAAARELARLGI